MYPISVTNRVRYYLRKLWPLSPVQDWYAASETTHCCLQRFLDSAIGLGIADGESSTLAACFAAVWRTATLRVDFLGSSYRKVCVLFKIDLGLLGPQCDRCRGCDGHSIQRAYTFPIQE